ncbi:hypothetical protein [Kitasatospora sp. NBC_01266]|uniref:hypothetical protein n=1 Tax=Kitasatospora sp. NBC_01266 TaxID=2903572 RepID=UPI002E350C04|nr:hypothetical protein [Kitasatospora sp. NBC_01266]
MAARILDGEAAATAIGSEPAVRVAALGDPGGAGPMTRVMLLNNIVEAAEHQAAQLVATPGDNRK